MYSIYYGYSENKMQEKMINDFIITNDVLNIKHTKVYFCTHQYAQGWVTNNGLSRPLFAAVIAHELGHLLGADHDRAAECTRAKHIMTVRMPTAITSGVKRFSSCSKRSILWTLNNLFYSRCISSKVDAFCGDGRIEGSTEECDCPAISAPCASCCTPRGGHLGRAGCMLRKGALCDGSTSCCDTSTCRQTPSKPCSAGECTLSVGLRRAHR